ncbi:cytochrome C biogenesis protein [Silanimonas sp.]|uniref:tetratricopeptide repeat protein n=1 Tax=Silanimonas sp. TaxID=1929290 RepID=UPI001BBFF397|nr:cytochrome C biogenesis protein [Silanimonas sp.]MBS3896329.1 cytochrome C biogenesis protein [Silanimonas sp.]MBS3923758.1 cytochrome C biogenesis protein [Xanthomonadaceae bacterium]
MLSHAETPMFLIGASALVVLSLAFVLPTLWREARVAALVMLAGIPLSAGGLYLAFGQPDALDPRNRVAPTTIEEAARQLERQLADEPDSLEGWILLGRTRKSLGRRAEVDGRAAEASAAFTAANAAFSKALSLAPENPDLQVEAAEALSLGHPERRFDTEATALLDAALRMRPNHQRGLWFRGVAALQAGDAAAAAGHWETLLPSVDAETAAALRPQIDRARADAGLPPLPGVPVAAEGPGVNVRIEADPAVLAALPAGAVLFVSARDAANREAPPVAARRIPSPVFPLELRLSDADSLMPTARLSSLARVEVSARFVLAGAVDGAGRGDLQAAPVAAEVGQEAIVPLVLTPEP